MKIVSSFPGVYQSHFLGEKILIASSGRQYSKDKRDEFLGALSLDPPRAFFVTQVHGNEIVEVDEKTSDTSSLHADGLITSVPGFGIGIRTADCLPVFFANSDQTVIGLAHAGWRGLHQGILEKMVKLFRGSYFIEAATIRILIGPAIRSCCYEVGEEFCGYFPETCASSTGSKPKMDLVREAKRRLDQEGVRLDHILDSGICTVCRNDQFFSARKEKTENRIFSVLQIIKN